MSSLPDQEMYELATQLSQKATEELKDVKDLKVSCSEIRLYVRAFCGF